MLERLPVPYGLVRSGVAPDHPKLKQVTRVFDRIAAHPFLTFVGNVNVGTDVEIDELLQTHHCVVLAFGASQDRKLGIPGEGLKGSHSATDFVGWYNGHPDHRHHAFDFDTEAAVIVGQGNVSIDVARVLSKPVDELRKTDIAEHALEALSKSRIQAVHIVGRRGPAQAKFSPQEVRELAALQGCRTVIKAADMRLGDVCQLESASKQHPGVSAVLRALEAVQATPEGASSPKTCTLRFYGRPHSILGRGCVEAVRFQQTRLEGKEFAQRAVDTAESFDIEAGLVFRSVGYRGVAMPQVPFDEASGTIPNEAGRVIDPWTKFPVPGVYVTGWIKRGPSGIIGTNRADSLETVATLQRDRGASVPSYKGGAASLHRLLQSRGVRVVGYDDWSRIDEVEKATGLAIGKPREKFTNIEQMLAAGLVSPISNRSLASA